MEWQPIIGVNNIARVMQRGARTIYRWTEKKNFPLSYYPSGERVTTPTLIDQWLLAIREAKLARNNGMKHEQSTKTNGRGNTGTFK